MEELSGYLILLWLLGMGSAIFGAPALEVAFRNYERGREAVEHSLQVYRWLPDPEPVDI